MFADKSLEIFTRGPNRFSPSIPPYIFSTGPIDIILSVARPSFAVIASEAVIVPADMSDTSN